METQVITGDGWENLRPINEQQNSKSEQAQSLRRRQSLQNSHTSHHHRHLQSVQPTW